MRRRDFIQGAVASALSAGLFRHPLLATAPNYDPYGGWTGKQFAPTGFFRVEKDARWWLVTPDGNAFLSFGINHIYPDLFNQPYNKASWQDKLGIPELESPVYGPALRKWFLEMRDGFGFNTIGVHNARQILNYPEPAMPYVQQITFVDIPHWKSDIPDENFLDIFSESFAVHCNQIARDVTAPLKEDPFLLGYAMTDCPLFTEEDCRERTDTIGGARRPARIGWPRRLRNLPEDAAGKQAFVSLMQELYRNNIAGFNTTYQTNFASFNALAQAENWRPQTDLSNGNETRDNIEFLKRCVAKYYAMTRDAIRRYDPNHLFLGDKLHANTDSLDTVLPVTSQYTDLIFYQMYARYEVQEPGLNRWSHVTDKPFINGDSAFTMITDTMPRPYGPVADNLQQRAEWTGEFFKNAFARPEFVGWHYCGLIDATQEVGRKQDRQHSGLLTGHGEPYPILQKVIKTYTDQMYLIAQGQK